MAASRDARYGMSVGGIVESTKYAVQRFAGMYFPLSVDFNALGANGLLNDANAGKADADCGFSVDEESPVTMVAMEAAD